MDPLHTEGSPLSKHELLTTDSAASVLSDAMAVKGSSHPDDIHEVIASAQEILDTVAARESLGDQFTKEEKKDIGALRDEIIRLEKILSTKH